MKIQYLLMSILVVCGLFSCSSDDSNDSLDKDKMLRVNINAESQMPQARTMKAFRADGAENNDALVKTLSLFVFDEESNLLEAMEQDVAASSPSKSNILGEEKVGEIFVSLPNSKPKNILVVANSSDNVVAYLDLTIGTTTYTELLETITSISETNKLAAPLVMTGYSNHVDPKNNAITITLKRKAAKLVVENIAVDKGLLLTSLQLKNVASKTFLFSDEMVTSANFIDYAGTTDITTKTPFYVYPQKAVSNNIKLEIKGSFNEKPFSQVVDVKPTDAATGLPVDIKSNYRYAIKLDVKGESVDVKVTIQVVEEWNDGEDVNGIITGDDEELKFISFNGLQWADRNLGATSSDLESNWEASIGKFYQWGRNTAFSNAGYQVVSGPLASLAEAFSDENRDKFIAGGFRDWINNSDNMLWQTLDFQPCSEELRLPTDVELMGIFTARGVIMNMVMGPKIVNDEKLISGIRSAHYWGDNDKKHVYGIKSQGTDDAYYMKWEYLKTGEDNPYLKISRWKASKESTFEGKKMLEVRNEFDLFTKAEEVLVLPGAGFITGSNGNYSKSEGGYYWSSTLAEDNKVYRAEFNTGKASMTEPYTSRISGHTIRCVKR